MTRAEILQAAKPILFNTPMVQAILEGQKIQTRRLLKEPYYIDDEVACMGSGMAMHRGTNETHGMPYPDSPYNPGDILYVRETWAQGGSRADGCGSCSSWCSPLLDGLFWWCGAFLSPFTIPDFRG